MGIAGEHLERRRAGDPQIAGRPTGDVRHEVTTAEAPLNRRATEPLAGADSSGRALEAAAIRDLAATEGVSRRNKLDALLVALGENQSASPKIGWTT